METYTYLQVLAEDAVKSGLKNPSTADFPFYDGWGVARSDDKYQIRGKVSEQNDFGVEKEMYFNVWFIKSNESFKVEAIEIDGNSR